MSSTHDRLLKLQKKVYRALQSEADRLLGPSPDAIRKYERGLRRDFSGAAVARPRSVTKLRLLRAVRDAHVVFVADYHTFPQAQRTALRILREAHRPGEHWCVGIEPISSRHQKVLDAFQAGRISLEEFHETVHYDDEWGFPWKNYAPIFQWARENGVRLVALNQPRELRDKPDIRGATVRRVRDMQELHERDRWAAGVLTDLFAEFPRKRLRVLVLYGELHVASAHLPKQLMRVSKDFLGSPLRSVTIHQNQDALYWSLARQNRELQTEVVELRKNSYCVLSSTPWAKLQSLVSWAEGVASGSDFSDDAEDGPVETDYLSMVRVYGELITEFLRLSPASYETLSVVGVDRADFVDALDPNLFTRSELALIRSHVLANCRIYVPRAEIAYLGTPSQNSAAELAALHIFRRSTRVDQVFVPDPKDPEDFFRLVIESAFGFLGSLVVNPRRKCDLPEDHRRRLQELRGGKAPSFRHERQARELTLSLLRSQGRLPGEPGPALRRALSSPTSGFATMMAAQQLGQILGKRIHHALLAGSLDPETVRELTLPRMASESTRFQSRYQRLLRSITRARTAASKRMSL